MQKYAVLSSSSNNAVALFKSSSWRRIQGSGGSGQDMVQFTDKVVLMPGFVNIMLWTGRRNTRMQQVVCLEANQKMKNKKEKENKKKPKIVKLRQEELGEVLRWSGSGEQILENVGGPPTWMTRVAVSLAGAVVFYNYNTLAAAIASLYWAWDPIWTMALSNSLLRLRYPYAGIWKARVLDANLRMPQQPVTPQGLDLFQEVFEARPAVQPLLHLIIGDESSATLEMRVKVPAKANMVQVGEPVEVLVVSDERSLSRFIAVHDVYLPNKRIWMSDSPCVEREAFEYISESLSFSSMQPAASQKRTWFQTAKADYDDIGYKSLPPKRQTPASDKLPASIELQLSEERYQRMMDLDDTLRVAGSRKLRQISTFDGSKFERLVDQEKVYPSPRQLGQVQTDDRTFGRRLEDRDFLASRPPLQRREKKVERLLDEDDL